MNKWWVALMPIIAILGIGLPFIYSGSQFFKQAGQMVIIISTILTLIIIFTKGERKNEMGIYE